MIVIVLTAPLFNIIFTDKEGVIIYIYIYIWKFQTPKFLEFEYILLNNKKTFNKNCVCYII